MRRCLARPAGLARFPGSRWSLGDRALESWPSTWKPQATMPPIQTPSAASRLVASIERAMPLRQRQHQASAGSGRVECFRQADDLHPEFAQGLTACDVSNPNSDRFSMSIRDTCTWVRRPAAARPAGAHPQVAPRTACRSPHHQGIRRAITLQPRQTGRVVGGKQVRLANVALAHDIDVAYPELGGDG